MKYIDPSELADKQILLRVDLNSPVRDGRVQKNLRFEKFSKTIESLAKKNSVTVLTHQGRPGREDFVSTKQHAAILGRMLDAEVNHSESVVGEEAASEIAQTGTGQVCLLENTRMNRDELPERPVEQLGNTELVDFLSKNHDLFINDAFPAAHRKHASIVGPYAEMESYHGPVMKQQKEMVESFRKKAKSIDGQVSAALGGDKPRDVFEIIQGLGDIVDTFLVSGVPAKILSLEDFDVSGKVYDSDLKQLAGEVREQCSDKIILPSDWALKEDGRRTEICTPAKASELSDIKDIGCRTQEKFSEELVDSKLVMTKGTPGVFEKQAFEQGTRRLFEAIIESDAYTLLGGGTTSNAARELGFDMKQFEHVSISGGAYLNCLLGSEMPAFTEIK